jgi:hypothetical protein
MIGGFGPYHLLSKKIEDFSGKLELICWRATLYPISPYIKRALLSIKISWCIERHPVIFPSPTPAPPTVGTGAGRQGEIVVPFVAGTCPVSPAL